MEDNFLNNLNPTEQTLEVSISAETLAIINCIRDTHELITKISDAIETAGAQSGGWGNVDDIMKNKFSGPFGQILDALANYAGLNIAANVAMNEREI